MPVATAKSFDESGLDAKLLLQTFLAVKNGDFTVRLPIDWSGIDGKIADTFNDIMDLNAKLAKETERAAKIVGKDGKISHRINLGQVDGAWANQMECMNSLVADLALPTREMARVIGAVAKGDLSQTAALEARGPAVAGRVPADGQDRQHDG